MKSDRKITNTKSNKSPKESRFIRQGKTLDAFLLRHYEAAGYNSPNEYIVGLIRQEMHKVEPLAKAA